MTLRDKGVHERWTAEEDLLARAEQGNAASHAHARRLRPFRSARARMEGALRRLHVTAACLHEGPGLEVPARQQVHGHPAACRRRPKQPSRLFVMHRPHDARRPGPPLPTAEQLGEGVDRGQQLGVGGGAGRARRRLGILYPFLCAHPGPHSGRAAKRAPPTRKKEQSTRRRLAQESTAHPESLVSLSASEGARVSREQRRRLRRHLVREELQYGLRLYSFLGPYINSCGTSCARSWRRGSRRRRSRGRLAKKREDRPTVEHDSSAQVRIIGGMKEMEYQQRKRVCCAPACFLPKATMTTSKSIMTISKSVNILL